MWYPAETDVSIRPGWFYHENQDGRVKTPEVLVDIYYSSVGRNSVLLLNIPPDKRGRIHGNDMKSLRGMRTILDETFKTNFAAGAKVTASSEKKGHTASSVIDEDMDNYWTSGDGIESASLDFELAAEQTFDRVMLEEDIRVGQRIEEFHLESWDGKQWRPFARGTTIGYKRLLRFPSVRAGKVRLIIDKSRTSPTLYAFGLYKSPTS
jgi:alpha-L-fucosidase